MGLELRDRKRNIRLMSHSRLSGTVGIQNKSVSRLRVNEEGEDSVGEPTAGIRDFQVRNSPGSPVAESLHFQRRGPGSVPGRGTAIPHTAIKDLVCCN